MLENIDTWTSHHFTTSNDRVPRNSRGLGPPPGARGGAERRGAADLGIFTTQVAASLGCSQPLAGGVFHENPTALVPGNHPFSWCNMM